MFYGLGIVCVIVVIARIIFNWFEESPPISPAAISAAAARLTQARLKREREAFEQAIREANRPRQF